jgi:hypothetical protein
MRTKIYCVIFAAILALAPLGCAGFHRSEDSVYNSLIKKTPKGSPCEAVEAYLKKKGLGYQVADGLSRPERYDAKDSRPDVKQTISAELDSYGGGFMSLSVVEVWGSWLIGTNNQLLDIYVWKNEHVQF